MHLASLIAFAAIALGMVLTPGPNMAYLVSRSVCQGRAAGLISLGGVALGFLTYMLLAAFGITALLFAIPYAYDALRLCGAAYLAWMAWNALRPGGASPFQVRELPPDSPRRLLAMGLLTNLLNPKIAVFYTSVLPSLVPHGASPVIWLAVLVATHVALSLGWLTGYAVLFSRSRSLLGRPRVRRCLDWMTGVVLIGFGLRLAVETR
jgi:threonine/homoserine/homoserine lactone efflux protein